MYITQVTYSNSALLYGPARLRSWSLLAEVASSIFSRVVGASSKTFRSLASKNTAYSAFNSATILAPILGLDFAEFRYSIFALWGQLRQRLRGQEPLYAANGIDLLQIHPPREASINLRGVGMIKLLRCTTFISLPPLNIYPHSDLEHVELSWQTNRSWKTRSGYNFTYICMI